MNLKKKVLTGILALAIISANYTYAEEGLTTPVNEEEVSTVEKSVDADNEVESRNENEETTNGSEDSSGFRNAGETPSVNEGVEISEANFPDNTLRNKVREYDRDADGYLSEQEMGDFTYLRLENYSTDEISIDLTGIGLLRNLTGILFGNNIKVVNGIKELEKLPNLKELNLGNVSFDEGLSNVQLANLESIGVNGNTIGIKDISHFKTLTSLHIEMLDESSLEFLKSFSTLQTFSTSSSNKIENLNLSEVSNTIKYIDLGVSNLKDLIGIEKYLNLETLFVRGGTISDLTPLAKNEKLHMVDISEQRLYAKDKFVPNEPFRAEDVKLLDNMILNVEVDKGSVENNNITWTDREINYYRFSAYSDNSTNNKEIRYYGKVLNVYPKDYVEGEWIRADEGKFPESFIKDGVSVLAERYTRNKDSLFSSTFNINKNVYTYSYYHGTDSTSAMYMTENNEENNLISDRLYYSNAENYIKKEGDKYYLKSIVTYDLGNGRKVRKEEISYIKDNGIVHDVTYTNISDIDISGVSLHQMIDTMLNQDDGVPIYADGRGNAYITSGNFKLFLEKLNDKGVLRSGPYLGGPLDERSKLASEYNRGDLLLDKADTAVYYGTDVLNLAPNESYSYSYKETIYTEEPRIEAKDKTIKIGEPWDPMDQLVGIYNQFGEELDKSKTVVEHKADPNKPGVYEITFIFNDVYTKTVTLTVLDEVYVPPVVENKDEPKPSPLKEKKVESKVVDTSDKSEMEIYFVSLLLSLGLIVGFRKTKKDK